MAKDSLLQGLREENRRLSAALGRSEARFRLFMDAVPDACVLLDGDFRYRYFNRAAEAFSGLSLERAMGARLLPCADGGDCLDRYRDVVRTGSSMTLEDVPVGGRFGGRRFRVHAFKVEEGLGVIWTDVTENRHFRQELVEVQSEMNSLAKHLIQTREEERKRIAREIHDVLGQALTAIDMELRWMTRMHEEAPDAVRDHIDGLLELSADALKTVQRIASELRPGILDHLGLAAALQWLADEQSKRHMIEAAIDVSIDESFIGERTATALFRITQEALTNIARHAGASRIEISFKEGPGMIELDVRDDGIGISEAQASGPESFGLMGMRERVRELGGSFAILGEGGAGTRVSVRVPIPTGGKLP
jgi:signal transduction histidine kinase